MSKLRKYQEDAIEELRKKIREGVRSVVLVAPTGAGKTTIAAHIIESAVKHGNSVLFLAHRKELIEQCSVRLDEQGVDHGIVKAGNKRRNLQPVQVASVQTLINRVRPRGDGIPHGPEAGIIIIDECHRATAKTYTDILEHYSDAFVLGLTATPYRTDGRGLSELFEDLVRVSSPAELTEMGFLVPTRVFSTPMSAGVAYDQIGHKGGDFDQEAAARAMDKSELVGDIYENWKKHAGDRTTVIFACSRKHAAHILAQFTERGEKIAYLDGETDSADRDATLRDLAERRIQIVVNVGLLTEGWDCPIVSALILARPTESTGLYLQMAGRALRPAPGKIDCIILDHGGNTARHGFVTDEREFSLAGMTKKKAADDLGAAVTTCTQCFALFEGNKCPACGFEVANKPRKEREGVPKQGDGELQELSPQKIRESEVQYFSEQYAVQQTFGYKENYAKAKFFAKFGRWPGREIGIITEYREEYKDGQRRYIPIGWHFNPKRVKDIKGNSARVRSSTAH